MLKVWLPSISDGFWQAYFLKDVLLQLIGRQRFMFLYNTPVTCIEDQSNIQCPLT